VLVLVFAGFVHLLFWAEVNVHAGSAECSHDIDMAAICGISYRSVAV